MNIRVFILKRKSESFFKVGNSKNITSITLFLRLSTLSLFKILYIVIPIRSALSILLIICSLIGKVRNISEDGNGECKKNPHLTFSMRILIKEGSISK